MRKLILAAALTAATFVVAPLVTPANAITLTTPAGALAAAEDLNTTEQVAYVCRWHPWRGRVCWWRPGFYGGYGGYGAYGYGGYRRPWWGGGWGGGWRRGWY